MEEETEEGRLASILALMVAGSGGAIASDSRVWDRAKEGKGVGEEMVTRKRGQAPW